MRSKIKKLTLSITVISIFLFAGCGRVINLGSDKEKMNSEESVSAALGNAKELSVIDVVGEIYVNKVEGDSVKVRAVKKVGGPTKEDVEKVMNNIAVSAAVNGDKLEVKAVTKDGGDDFWNWKSDNYNSINVNIDFYVDIPKDLPNYSIKNVTGNIEIKNVKGAFEVEAVTGNIAIKDTAMEGVNGVQLVTGNISVYSVINNAKEIDVNNTTGNIELGIPKDSKFSIDGRVVTGSVGGNFSGLKAAASLTGGSISQEFNGGDTKVKANVVTGSLKINEK